MAYSAEVRLDHLGLQSGDLEPRRSHGRWHFWMLVISLSVNVAMVAFFVFQIQEGVLWFEVETLESSTTALPEVSRSESLKTELAQLISATDDELISALDDEKVVANGYHRQELALAVLRLRGYLVEDPLRPLGAWPQPMAGFSWTDPSGKSLTLKLFSNLGAREIQAVKAFIRETAVPFTAEGIVRKIHEGQDSSLMRAALIRTDEWTTFARLFSSLSETELIVFVKALGEESFSTIVEWGRVHVDPQEIGPFVVALFSKYPSTVLAELIASRYADVAVLQASDDTVLLLYSHLPPQSEAGVRFAMRLLHGQRKLAVWQASQAYLARAASMPTLSSMKRDEVLEWLRQIAHPERDGGSSARRPEAPAERRRDMALDAKPSVQKGEPSIVQPPSASKSTAVKPLNPRSQVSTRVATRQLKPYRTYVVKKGDTLWSVARRFNADVEKLKYLNGLKGTALAPGMVLRIPH